MRVSVVQVDASMTGPKNRFAWLDAKIRQAAKKDVDLIIFPELFLSGYNVGEALHQNAEVQDDHRTSGSRHTSLRNRSDRKYILPLHTKRTAQKTITLRKQSPQASCPQIASSPAGFAPSRMGHF
jgi:predicted amidohydrolase